MQARHVTLEADTPQTVATSIDAEFVEVLVRTAEAAVFFTVDGSVPTVAGDDCYVVVGVGALSVRFGGRPSVKLVSSGAADVSVTAYTDDDVPRG